ncbi:hypothetical protein [Aggregatibacter kilianii]|uniref:hypothetical protein n=1 Tax=Aggregatibacter kilianii TaxID=2025884 RepID=UPI000D646DF6|nr:hypothetical protein [Aggregatibacter kilianii]
MANIENESGYILEILPNDGGYRGLLINVVSGIVERRTRVNNTKELACMALESLVEEFVTSYPKADILGVSKIDDEIMIKLNFVRGLFEVRK